MSPYDVLGITPDATLLEVETARRRLAEFYEPARYASDDVRAEAACRLRDVNDAYYAAVSDAYDTVRQRIGGRTSVTPNSAAATPRVAPDEASGDRALNPGSCRTTPESEDPTSPPPLPTPPFQPDIPEVSRWLAIEDIGDAEEAAEWRDAGFTPEAARCWLAVEDIDDASAATAWRVLGCSSEDAAAWLAIDDIDFAFEAEEWIDAGFSPAQAAPLIDAGYDPESAAKESRQPSARRGTPMGTASSRLAPSSANSRADVARRSTVAPSGLWVIGWLVGLGLSAGAYLLFATWIAPWAGVIAAILVFLALVKDRLNVIE